jgi:iron complex outermembrane receptor protein
MMQTIHRILLTTVLLSLISSVLLAQVKSVYEKMSLDELLNIDVVVTASKKPEDLFDAPLSVTIIKKEEITRSGATSIPEALRLSPGLIVREITPGNYDVQIRGYDDITKNVYLTLPYNTTTLVMIDNRIVYSYFTGGTFWETFPIDLNDIERIEVVRGPASALYGPNAVTGVINIITSHANKQGMNIFTDGSAGTNQAKNIRANIGYNWNDKTKISFSGNFAERHRYTEEYFDFNTKTYTSADKLSMFMTPLKNDHTNEAYTFKEFQEIVGAWYDEDLSLRKMGGNIFFYHNFSEQSSIDIAMGAQNSQSQKTGFLNLVTALSQIESKSYYLNTIIKHKNLSGQFNINSGQDFSNYKFNSLKFTTIDGNLDYYKQFNEFSLRPGISYKHAIYNSPITYDEPFSVNTLNFQFKDEPRISSAYAASVLAEWKPDPKLRIIGAIRIDKFDINKYFFTNYEIASTYRLNKNNLVRFVYSRANKSPFIFDSYLKSSILTNVEYVNEDSHSILYIPVDFNIRGQEDLKFPAITNQEICWRTTINSNLSLDLELFYSSVKNFVNANIYRQYQVVQQLDQLGKLDSLISVNVKGDLIFENYDVRAQQFGAGFTLNYNLADKFIVKLYGTYQKTKLSGRSDIEIVTTNIHMNDPTPDHILVMDISTRLNPTQWSEKLTPSFFGGFTLNYKLNDNWNFSTDAYFYTDQIFTNYNYYKILDEKELADAKVQMDIQSNIILNAKASYRFNKNTTAYATLKNCLGNQYEYGFADQIGTLFLVGLRWEF